MPDQTFLILGHSRSGTGYMAALMACFGFAVGHEEMRRNGMSCWSWSTHDPCPPWAPGQRNGTCGHIIHVLRNPLDVIASVAHTDARECWTAEHEEYAATPKDGIDGCLARDLAWCAATHHRRKYTVQFPEWSHLDNVALGYLQWTNMIQAQGPTLTLQVEQAPEAMAEHLGVAIPADTPPADTNTREHPPVEMQDFSAPVRGAITRFCERWGYEVPTDA